MLSRGTMGSKSNLALQKFTRFDPGMVHADLLNGAASVSEVALRWEFPHLGRFAGRYKALFGESPKTTRDRAIS